MDYQSLHMKTVVELRKLAKDQGVRVPAGTNKETLIQLLLESEGGKPAPAEARQPEKPAEEADKPARRRGRPPKAASKPEDGEKPAEKPRRGRPLKSAAKAIEEKQPEPAEAPKPEAPAKKPEPAEAPKPEAPAKKPEPAEAPKPEAPAKKPEPAEAPKPEAPSKKSEPAEAPKPAETPKPEAPAPKPESTEAPKLEEKKPEDKKPEAPAQPENRPAGEGRPVFQNRGAASYRMNPRPAGDDRQRLNNNRGFQNWSNNRPAQGEARNPRYGQNNNMNNPSGPSAARPMNNRFCSRPGDARPAYSNWENRDAQRRAPLAPAAQPAAPAPAQPVPPTPSTSAVPAPVHEAERPRPDAVPAEYRDVNPAVPEMLAAGECGDGAGVLELQPDGYGFLRAENCLPGPNDVYISIAQIRRFNLRNGDQVVGKTRAQREGDRYSAMMYITEVNGESPDKAAERPRFEDLVPIYPDQRFRLEPPAGGGDLSLRLIDMLAPIGKGQRGMIVSQPKAGKTTLLKKVANAITAQYPDVHLIVLLIDERPEEVTDMQRSIKGEVVYSTFDEAPENHIRVSEMVLGRAQRLVEMGKDVVVLLDSITRLARAYNLTITPTGRSLSGGLDPGALFKPKRFFGAARNIENGGSLTIIATALVETGSRMDDIIFEEFKGTGNMELHLDRKLSDRRVFPAIDLLKSGTRREELLLTPDELNGEYQVRKMLSGRQQEMYEQLIDLMSKTATNADFFSRLKGWLAVYEKEGYSLGR